jgi:hypothetical protein
MKLFLDGCGLEIVCEKCNHQLPIFSKNVEDAVEKAREYGWEITEIKPHPLQSPTVHLRCAECKSGGEV